jgi:hypothetical protein
MTGVGFAAGGSEVGDVRIEVRTVNGRGFAAKIRVPSTCSGYEAAIEELVRAAVHRSLQRCEFPIECLLGDLRLHAIGHEVLRELGVKDEPLLDLAVERFSGGSLPYDEDGRWAASGQVNGVLIAEWLQEPYFLQAPPKSTGRELFGAPDLERRLAELTAAGSSEPADALASLTAFTAAVVAADLKPCITPLELLVQWRMIPLLGAGMSGAGPAPVQPKEAPLRPRRRRVR